MTDFNIPVFSCNANHEKRFMKIQRENSGFYRKLQKGKYTFKKPEFICRADKKDIVTN